MLLRFVVLTNTAKCSKISVNKFWEVYFMVCKKCGQVVEEGFNNCPNCGKSLNGKQKEKKPIFKKWWFWLIIILLIGVIFGSSNENDDTTPSESNPTDIVTESDSVDTTAPTTTEPSTPQSWTKNFYVDDFDEPTDEWYVSRSFLGTFSNSATSDSRLKGDILIDENDISIFLYEYYTHQVKNPYSRSEGYIINVRLEDGTTKKFNGYIYSEGDRIYVDESDVASMKKLLMNGGEMKFYIYEKDNSVTNYLFEISSDNLKDLIG